MDFVVSEMARTDLGDLETMIMNETPIDLVSGTHLRPDPIIQNREGLEVVDIIIHHKNETELVDKQIDEIEKYEHLVPLLAERFVVTPGCPAHCIWHKKTRLVYCNVTPPASWDCLGMSGSSQVIDRSS